MKLRNKKIKYLLITFLLVFMLLGTTLITEAHKVILYAYVEGQKIIVEGGFGDGSIAKNAEVKVYDLINGNLLTEGVTNNEGRCKLDIPAKTDLKIVLNAGMGHQAEYTISKDELPDISNKNKSSKRQADKLTGKNSKKTKVTGINEDKLRSIISQELDKKMAPLNKKLVQIENNKGPGVTEILGGIGYIFGLMGLALYFTKGRNKS